ncbi:unnamed protein product [Linum tenue]|uniref:MIF4G domain-containing protein n=1 Tax=Linum tenue TaxID=586396 RepID=A0AAV0QNF7_9ROSI|nr:unnamed protein product [Linum tenue]
MSSWRTLLLRIGNKCPEYGGSADVKEHIETCCGVVRRELEHSAGDISSFLIQCAEGLPHKIPLLGTVIGLLNLENENFVRGVIETTQTRFQEALDSGNCDRIRVLVRFLTALMCSKVLQAASLVVVFETLLSSAAITVDEEKGNPSCNLCAASSRGDGVSYGWRRGIFEHKKSLCRHWLVLFEDDNDLSAGEKDFLEDLWDRIKFLSSNGWKADSFPRPHLAFEAQLVGGKAHEFGPINAPEQPEPLSQFSGITYGREKHNAELRYPQRIRRLYIFPTGKSEDMQPVDRFIVEEYLLDVLLFLNGCFVNILYVFTRKECASKMVSLPVPFRYEYLMAETLFCAEDGSSFNSTREVSFISSADVFDRFCYRYVVWLLLLPQPPFRPLYYTLVIMDLCKALPGAFPAVVAGAVRALFEKIADLDMECRNRLILWFSHHLSNFQFIWRWEEWAYVLDLPKWAPQRVFVQEVVEREVCLSYWEKIKQSIENAPALEELLPPKGSPNFKYSVEDGREKTEYHAISTELSNKSFTHLITVLERYGQVITRLCPDLDNQILLIAEILGNAISKTYNRMSDLRKEVVSLKKNVLVAEEAAARAKAELDASESKLTLMNGEPVMGDSPVKMKRLKSHADKAKEEEESVRDSLDAKEALLARATVEKEELFLALYKNFSNVLKERLPDASKAQTLRDLKSTRGDEMAVDTDQPSTMEVDDENGGTKKSKSNGESESSNVCNIGEKEQWCLSTLGHIKSFSRQYASEVWSHIEKLDAEVLAQDIHPLFRRAVYSGLRRPINELASG